MSRFPNDAGRDPQTDFRHRGVRDAAFLLTLVAFAYVASLALDVLGLVHLFSSRYTALEIDRLFMTSLVVCAALMVFAWRRIRDLSQEVEVRKAAEDKAATLSRQDPLTGLPNRHFLIEKVGSLLRETTGADEGLAVLIADVDGLSAVNDLYGHAAADRALADFAARIKDRTDAGAVLARIGDQRVAVLQPGIHGIEDPTRLAHQLMMTMSEPFAMAGRSVKLGINIGIAVAPDDARAAEDLIRRATVALHHAKTEGRASVRFFERDMDRHLENRARVEQELGSAIKGGTLAAHYHPIVALPTGRIIGFEALARWKDPVLGWVSPLSFIPAAEESGQIGELGSQLLRRACTDAKLWPSELKLAINVSPRQLEDPALGLRILSILGETGFDPRRLELEITEGALLGDPAIAANVFRELRRAGIRIAIDGCGTGYATLSHLLALPFDKIKIARAIVHRLGKDPRSEVLVRGLVEIAAGLDLTISAEGIERPEQLARVVASGCMEGQGFLFGKVVPPKEIPALLRRPLPSAKAS